MPRVGVDLTSVDPVEDSGFKLLPPEDSPYILQVQKCEHTKSKKGNMMFVFDFEVLSPEQHAGETFRQWYPLVKQGPSLGRLRALANACDVAYDRDGVDTDEFPNAVLECDLLVEPADDGREFNRLERPRPAPRLPDEGNDEQPEAASSEGEPPAEPPAEEPPAAPARRAPARSRVASPRPPKRGV